jgi:HEPN domain-containing protein
MPREEVKEFASLLLRKAKIDLGAIRKMYDSGDDYDPVLGFHAQQAIEKAIKAVIVYEGIRLVKTHNLRMLINICGDKGIDVPGITTSLERLTRYGVEDRYFEFDDEPGETLDRKLLVKDVETFVDWAERVVNG